MIVENVMTSADRTLYSNPNVVSWLIEEMKDHIHIHDRIRLKCLVSNNCSGISQEDMNMLKDVFMASKKYKSLFIS